MRPLALAAVLVPLTLAVPASAAYDTDSLVQVGSASATAGAPAPTGHGVDARCDMIRTNKTLVKFWGGAAATGHTGVTRTRIACQIQAWSPSQGTLKVFTVTGDEAGPFAAASGSAGVYPDSVVSVCVQAASAEWSDGHVTSVLTTC